MAETFDMSDNGLDSEHEGFPLNLLILRDNAPDLQFHERDPAFVYLSLLSTY